jgi:hypothetical protein
VGEIADEVSRFVEKMELFGSAFDSTGFGTVGSEGNQVVGEDAEERVVDATEEFWIYGGGMKRRKPLTDEIERPLEADSRDGNLPGLGRLEDEGSNEIIGHPMHVDFAMNHIGRETA